MTAQSFYERYWGPQPAYKGKGVAELPPEWNEENLERILKFCRDKSQGRVLDVGCGDGFFTAQIHSALTSKMYMVLISHQRL